MTISRRSLIAGLGALPAASLLARNAHTAYADRPITLVVPFAAGGNADIVGRLIGQEIGAALKQPVVVENRAGAGGGVGARAVAKAEPDGYTLLVGSNGPLTINPLVQANPGYDPTTDFAPVALTSYVPHVLVLANSVPAKTVAELVALSKQGPVNIATSGVGSATHMSLERLKAATSAGITHVPYRSGGALMPDVMSGAIQGAMTEFSTAMELHTGGKARIVALAAAKRSALAPDIPTFIESGVKDFTAQSFVGILAPAKTPPAIVDQLQAAIAAGLASGTAPERLRALGSEIATAEQATSKGFAAFIKADAENMREAARLAGITPQ
jgi:tripartite-type tricarboxylate transporter receptor subunit TctC